jgi:Spy/CpxP family protein refolding chaperone
MKLKNCIAVLFVISATTVWAQPDPSTVLKSTADSMGKPPAAASSKPGQTASLERNFFGPELIMLHQNAIGLTADQQTAIRAEMQKMIAQFTDLQWQESAEAEALNTLARLDRPDEKQVLAQLDKLLNIENQIKRLNIGMLIRIKNLLTPEQQAQLQELQKSGGARPRALSDQKK